MPLMAMHAAVAQKSHQMQTVTLCLGLTQRIEQHGIMIEPAFVDVFVDQSQILEDNAAGTENHMAHFRVAHLTRRQADIDTGHGQARIGIIAQQSIEIGRGRIGDGVEVFARIDAEAVQE